MSIDPLNKNLCISPTTLTEREAALLAKAGRVYEEIKTYTLNYLELTKNDSDYKLIVKVFAKNRQYEDFFRIGTFKTKKVNPCTVSYNGSPGREAFEANILMLARDSKKRGLSLPTFLSSVSELISCSVEGEIVLDRHRTKEGNVAVPVSLSFCAIPDFFANGYPKIISRITDGVNNFPDSIISSGNNFISLDKSSPITLRINLVPLKRIKEVYEDVQQRTYNAVCKRFVPGNNVRLFSDSCGELADASVVRIKKADERLSDTDLEIIAGNVQLSNQPGVFSSEDRDVVYRAIVENLNKEQICPEVLCNIDYTTPALRKSSGSSSVYIFEDELTTKRDCTSTNCFIKYPSFVHDYIGGGGQVKIVAPSHIREGLINLQLENFLIACNHCFLSGTKKFGYKYKIVQNGKDIGVIKPRNLYCSSSQFSEDTVNSFLDRLKKEDVSSERNLTEGLRKLVERDGLSLLCAPKLVCDFEFFETAPSPWDGCTSNHLGKMVLLFPDIGSGKTVHAINNKSLYQGKHPLSCCFANEPSDEANRHLQGFLSGSSGFFEVFFFDVLLPKNSRHELAIAPQLDSYGSPFYRNIEDLII